MNREGYRDPTADNAVGRVNKIPTKATRLKRLIIQMADMAGYEVKTLELKQKKTRA